MIVLHARAHAHSVTLEALIRLGGCKESVFANRFNRKSDAALFQEVPAMVLVLMPSDSGAVFFVAHDDLLLLQGRNLNLRQLLLQYDRMPRVGYDEYSSSIIRAPQHSNIIVVNVGKE